MSLFDCACRAESCIPLELGDTINASDEDAASSSKREER